jgi:hypothetical protein
VGEEPLGLAQVGLDVGGTPVLCAAERVLRTGHEVLVVVRVDHVCPRRRRLRHLVHVLGAQRAGSEIEELVDSGVLGQVTNGAEQERPVLPRHGLEVAEGRDRVPRRLLVGRRMAVPAEVVVVHASRAGATAGPLRSRRGSQVRF